MALVQSPTMTMLQTRPSSQEAFQTQPPLQTHQRYSPMPRPMQHASAGMMPTGNYRGQTTSAAPYSFQPPQRLQHGHNPLAQHPTGMAHPSMGPRTASAPAITSLQTNTQLSGTSNRPRPPVMNAGTTPLNQSYTGPWPNQGQAGLKESPIISSLPPVHHAQQSSSAVNLTPPAMTYASVAKSSPDRYRRNHRRAETGGALNSNGLPVQQGGYAMPSGSGMASVGHLYHHPTQTSSTPALTSYSSYNAPTMSSPPIGKDHDPMGHQRISSKDDMSVQRQSSDLAKRYRRRSISSIEAKEHMPEPQPVSAQPKTYAAMLAGPAPSERKENRPLPPSAMERPNSSHGRQTSNESIKSGRSSSRPSSVCYTFFYYLSIQSMNIYPLHKPFNVNRGINI